MLIMDWPYQSDWGCMRQPLKPFSVVNMFFRCPIMFQRELMRNLVETMGTMFFNPWVLI